VCTFRSLLSLLGERAETEHSVLGLQDDVHAGRDEVGHEGRHADAEVDVVAVAQFERDTLGDLIAGQRGHYALLLRTVRCSIGFSYAVPWKIRFTKIEGVWIR